jgi:hypothetical protein
MSASAINPSAFSILNDRLLNAGKVNDSNLGGPSKFSRIGAKGEV